MEITFTSEAPGYRDVILTGVKDNISVITLKTKVLKFDASVPLTITKVYTSKQKANKGERVEEPVNIDDTHLKSRGIANGRK